MKHTVPTVSTIATYPWWIHYLTSWKRPSNKKIRPLSVSTTMSVRNEPLLVSPSRWRRRIRRSRCMSLSLTLTPRTCRFSNAVVLLALLAVIITTTLPLSVPVVHALLQNHYHSHHRKDVSSSTCCPVSPCHNKLPIPCFSSSSSLRLPVATSTMATRRRSTRVWAHRHRQIAPPKQQLQQHQRHQHQHQQKQKTLVATLAMFLVPLVVSFVPFVRRQLLATVFAGVTTVLTRQLCQTTNYCPNYHYQPNQQELAFIQQVVELRLEQQRQHRRRLQYKKQMYLQQYQGQFTSATVNATTLAHYNNNRQDTRWLQPDKLLDDKIKRVNQIILMTQQQQRQQPQPHNGILNVTTTLSKNGQK